MSETTASRTGSRMSSNRTPLMAGNWKMNLDHLQGTHLVQKLDWTLRDAKHDYGVVEVAVLVPFTDLRSVQTLIEGDKLPVEGAEVIFRKAELNLSGRIAWVAGKRAGLSFSEVLHPDLVMRHIPTPRPRVQPDFRRPGLSSRPLSAEDMRVGERRLPRSPYISE